MQRLSATIRLLIISVLVSSLGCSSGSSSSNPSPTQPSPTPPATGSSVSGSWSGSASDSSGPGDMTWQITQSGTSFSGTLTMTFIDAAKTSVTGRGTVAGTVSGASMTFTLTVLAGGFDNPYGSCSANVSGTGTASATSITGTYTGSSSCGGAISAGQLTLNKQ